MIKVFCFIGGASSGKDYIFNIIKLLSDVKPIISIATRKPRIGEKEGESYYFKTYKEAMKLDFIEKRIYIDSDGNPQIYGIPKAEIDLNSNIKYISVVDFDGYKNLQKYVGKKGMVYSIFIDCSAKERLKRSIFREEQKGKLSDKKINEICFRQLDDFKKVTSQKNKCNLIIENETKSMFGKELKRIIDFIKK